MNVETLQELILLYLYNKSYHLNNLQVVQYNDGLLFKYTSIHFYYCGHEIEIRIYNSNFIKIKIDNTPGVIKDTLSSVRDYIDSVNYRY